MRYLIAVDRERGEGLLSTETGIVLRYIQEAGEDVISLLSRLTDKIPFNKKQAAIHISYGDKADYTACDILEEQVSAWAAVKTEVLCEDRLVHRLYAAFPKAADGIALYVSPDAGAGRLYQGSLAILGGVGAPFYSGGSAYNLGAAVIRGAVAGAEKTGPATALTTFLEEALGLPISEAKSELAQMEAEEIASYARLAAKGRLFGDAVATALWNENVSALARYVHTLSPGEEKLCVCGSEIPKTWASLLMEDLTAVLGDRFTVSCSHVPVLLGGIRRCAEMLGIPPGEAFTRTFLETYKNLST